MNSSEARSKLFSTAKLGKLSLRNRIVKAATFEGMCAGGIPSDQLIAFHKGIAAGGTAMTTVAYCSVSADGRSYDTQMVMGEDILPQLRMLTDAVHSEGAAASIQLGHCGYFADKDVIGGAPLAPSFLFNTYGLGFSRAMNQADIDRVTGNFAEAARLAKKAGFDAVEVHAGHGYLLSQFLSPFTNRRKDNFGGSLENRLRFPLAVIKAVRAAVGPDFAIVVKTNLRDGFEGGLEVPEAVEIAKAFEAVGVDALELSGGFVSKAPLYMMRGDVPLSDMIAVQDSTFRKIGLFFFGRIFVQKFPYTETFFLEEARKVRAAVKMPLILMGGIKSAENMDKAMQEGFDFVAIGRALIYDSNFVNDVQRGAVTASGCVPCNKCIAEMDRGGVRCVRNPQKVAA